jgi:acyl-CoA thioester hydrolase
VSAPEPKILIELPIAMRWRDLDAFNHANNSTFLTYIEEARLHWFTHIDGAWFTETLAPVVAAIQVNYRRQLAWPANVVVQLQCERIGNTSITLAHRIVDGADPGVVYSDGQTVLVWIDTASGKPVALPEAIRRACQ